MRELFIVMFNNGNVAYNQMFQTLANEDISGARFFECSVSNLHLCPVNLEQSGLSESSVFPAVAFFEQQENTIYYLENRNAPFDRQYILNRINHLQGQPGVTPGGGGVLPGDGTGPGGIGLIDLPWWLVLLLAGYAIYELS